MKKYLFVILTITASIDVIGQTASGGNTLAIGTMVTASGANSLASGFNVQSIGQNSAVFGRQSKANGTNSFVVGEASTANNDNSIAIGYSLTSNGGIAIGGPLSTSTGGSLAFGCYINNNGKTGSVGFGDYPYDKYQLNNDADNQMLMRFANGYRFQLTNSKIPLAINPNGTVNIDQSNSNNGTLPSGGLLFGNSSGEGIASRRTSGGNQWGLDFYSNFTNRMSITNAGKVGVGTTTPQQMLSVAGSMNIDQNNGNTYGLNPGLTFGSNSGEGISSNRVGGTNNNSYGLDFYAGGLVRMAINNAGNVGIGYFNPNTKLEVAGNIYATGTITPSDIRYKKDISLVKNALNKIMSISGYYYSFKTNEFPNMGLDTKKQIGVIAQEVEEVVPEVVVTRPDGYKTVDYPKLIPLLIQGMKEQQQQIEELKKLVTELIKNK